jgi:nitrite reductase (NADH) large subunit
MRPRLIIAGNGVAGVTAARTIARVNPEARIEIYSSEPYHYYIRPRLWEFLAGKIEQEDLYAYPPEWYQRQGIEVHLGKQLVRLDPDRRAITLVDGRVVSYERLLLSTGGHPLVPPIPGVEKEGVFTLRTVDDAVRMKAHAKDDRQAIAVGGGLLGLETARALRLSGLKVTVVELLPRLLPRQLDAEGAALLTGMIEAMDIQVMTGAAIQAIAGDDRARGVVLQSGEMIPGELILISAGIRPNVQLAREAGLAVGRGVVVDEYLRTSVEEVYAAGDAAEFRGRSYGNIPAAVEQGRVAGMHMAGGAPEPYQGTVPAYTLKIVGIDLTSVGMILPEGEGYQELRWMDEASGRYKKFVLRDGRLVGAILLGERGGVGAVVQLISSGVDISYYADRLLVEDFDLTTLRLTADAVKEAS